MTHAPVCDTCHGRTRIHQPANARERRRWQQVAGSEGPDVGYGSYE